MIRVLIADDHPIMLSGVEAILTKRGYHVVASLNDGESVLSELASARPDVLILDIRMADRSGMDVLRTLRSRGDARPVILLTAQLDDRDLVEAIQLGVNGILLKDGAQSLLVKCLEEVVAGRRWIEKSLLERALDVTLDKSREPQGLDRLSARERTVAGLIARGYQNRAIAVDLGMSEGTVKVYLHRIYEKLGIANRTELAVLVRDSGAP